MQDIGLRQYIVYLRDEVHLSFQDISDKIEKEYGIKRTKQAIYGLYSREKKRGDTRDSTDTDLKIDIVNMYVLGYSKSDILHKLSDRGVSYNKIRYILDSNKSLIEYIQECKIAMLVDKLNSTDSYERLKATLRYKGIEPKDGKFRHLLKIAYIRSIQDYLNTTLEHIKEIDKAVGRRVKKEIKPLLNIDTSDNSLSDTAE